MLLCALGVLLCQKLSHNVWESPLSLFLKDRFLFTSQLQAGSAHGFIWGQGCVRACVYFIFLFERTMLWRPTANPKFGIPDMVMRKQTFLHLK